MKFKKNTQRVALAKYSLLLLLALGFISAKAQTPVTATGDKIYTGVQENPQPAGGFSVLYKFLGENIKYPREMKEKGVQGKVMVQFIVEKDGSLTNIKAVRGPGYGAEEESVRVMGLSPKWIPGQQDGKSVRVQFTIPISFALGNGGTPLPK
jgi:protein TonB